MKEPIIYVATRNETGSEEMQIFQPHSGTLGYNNYILRDGDKDYWCLGETETYDWIEWGWELREATAEEKAYYLSCQHHNPPLKDGLIKKEKIKMKEVIKLYPIF